VQVKSLIILTFKKSGEGKMFNSLQKYLAILLLMLLVGCNFERTEGLDRENPLSGSRLQFSLSTKDLKKSLGFYEILNFRTISISEDATPPWALISDGSHIFMLSQHEFPSPTLTFYGLQLEDRLKLLENKGISVESIVDDEGTVTSAIIDEETSIGISLINYDPEKLPKPSLQNGSMLGDFLEIRLPAPPEESGLEFWGKLGFDRSKEDIGSGRISLAHPLLQMSFSSAEQQTSPALYYKGNLDSLMEILQESEIEFTEVRTEDFEQVQFFSPDGQLFTVRTKTD
jgi:hypothetical protein